MMTMPRAQRPYAAESLPPQSAVLLQFADDRQNVFRHRTHVRRKRLCDGDGVAEQPRCAVSNIGE